MNEQRELERRRDVALAAIRTALERTEPEAAVASFIAHHLAELDDAYWLERTGSVRPPPERVLDMLELQAHWSDAHEDGMDVFDFTLPGAVTDYVISVRFDQGGRVERIVMES